MSDENQKRSSGAFDNISKAAAAYGEIPKKLQPTLDRLPALANKVDKTLTIGRRLRRQRQATVRQLRPPGHRPAGAGRPDRPR
jgi:phospholipid/cholesterol/gamma-HCH transport system substrate-binding protein